MLPQIQAEALHDVALGLIHGARGHYIFGNSLQDCLSANADPTAAPATVYRAQYKGYALAATLLNGPLSHGSGVTTFSLKRAILHGNELGAGEILCSSGGGAASVVGVYDQAVSSISCAAW